FTTTVDSAGSVGWESSLALDAAGNPSIAYLDNTLIGCRKLKYASNNGSSWNVEIVDDVGDTGQYPSLSIDQDGDARISYTGELCPVGACGRLKYAKLTASGWVTHTILSAGGDYGFYSSLRLTPDDQPHISFFDHSTGDLKDAFIPSSLLGVAIGGPESGTAGSPYNFTASISPQYATQPVTYTWQADDQPPATHLGGGSDSAAFTWESIGTKLIQITADNSFSQVSSTHTITITDVAISGLVAISNSPTPLGQPTTLSASVQDGTNVVFDWDFGDGVSGSGAQVTHTYPATGSYTARVTA
ncbi:MAG: PKD domain-containing protein, partial [Anaerolineales bacterium]